MQTQIQDFLEGFLSIYDFSPSVTNPYEYSVKQSLAQHLERRWWLSTKCHE